MLNQIYLKSKSISKFFLFSIAILVTIIVFSSKAFAFTVKEFDQVGDDYYKIDIEVLSRTVTHISIPKSEYGNKATDDETYTLDNSTNIDVTPETQTFASTLEVEITSSEAVTIYYTTDESLPSTTNGTMYNGPFTITESTVLKAIAID